MRARLEKIEDVRPLVGALQWPFYESERMRACLGNVQHDALRQELRQTVHTLAKNFLELPYFQAWRDRRADYAFEAAFQALRVIDPGNLDALTRGLADLIDRVRGDSDVNDGAAREDLSALGDTGMRYVVYGHTHDPILIPLRAGMSDDLYLNSGTWRCREFHDRRPTRLHRLGAVHLSCVLRSNRKRRRDAARISRLRMLVRRAPLTVAFSSAGCCADAVRACDASV